MKTPEASKAFLFRPKEFAGLSQRKIEQRIFSTELDTTLGALTVAGIELGLYPNLEPRSAYIVGPTLEAIYERFFGEQCPYSGDTTEALIRNALHQRKAVPIIVSEEVFSKLSKLQGDSKELISFAIETAHVPADVVIEN